MLDALQVLKTLREENRSANEDEKEILAKFPGWGWTGNTVNLFASQSSDPEFLAEITALLTKEELEAAAEATLNSHYTSPGVIRSMWKIAERLGFEKGPVLEPSAGIGFFLGMKPASIDAQFTAVELDTQSGRILSELYQASDIRVQGYQQTNISAGQFAMVIGNIPFGNLGITDLALEKELGAKAFATRVHNYFMVRAMRDLADNGIAILITSAGTMDAKDSAAMETRSMLRGMGDLIGAIRLPNTTFRGNAATDVTTDILILRKRPANQSPSNETFLNLAAIETQEGALMMVNEYFQRHPEMVIGQHSNKGKMNKKGSSEDQYTLQHPTPEKFEEITGRPLKPEEIPQKNTEKKATNDAQIEAALQAVIEKLPKNIMKEAPVVTADDVALSGPKPPKGMRAMGLFEVDGKFYSKIDDFTSTPHKVSAANVKQLRDLIALRDAALDVLKSNQETEGEDALVGPRAELNKQYEAYVKAHGRINIPTGKTAQVEDIMGVDSSVYLLLSLESIKKNADKSKTFVRKSDIFEKRVINYASSGAAKTPADAIVMSMGNRGRIDFEYIEQRSGITKKQLLDEMEGTDLFYDQDSESYLPKFLFGSGNVVKRLIAARKEFEASQDPMAEKYVKFLESVQPERVPLDQIFLKLGAPYIKKEIVEKFLRDVTGQPGIVVKFSSVTQMWQVDDMQDDALVSPASVSTVSSATFVSNVLNNRRNSTVIKDRDGAVLSEETKKANEELGYAEEAFQELFNDWLGDSPELSQQVEDNFNNEVNVMVLPKYDGSMLNLEGVSELWAGRFRPHQLNQAFRMAVENNTLSYHEVGTGKSATMFLGAMMMKRMGIRNKPMFVFKNGTEGQMAHEFLEVFPNANILVVDPKMMSPQYRKQLVATIATNNFDAVMIRHTDLKKIPPSEATYQAQINAEINEYKAAMAEELGIDIDDPAIDAYSKERELEPKPNPGKPLKAKLKALQISIAKEIGGDSYKYYLDNALRDPRYQELLATAPIKMVPIKEKSPAGFDQLSITAKELAAKLRTIKESYQKHIEKMRGYQDDGVTFEELGVDALIVDESHIFKKITIASRAKGFGQKGSAYASDLLAKAQYLRDRKGAMHFMTGTPITNSLSEMYGLFKFLRPDILPEMGIYSFDSWLNVFGNKQTRSIVTVTGSIVQKEQIKSFVNVPELMKLFYSFTDLVKANDISGLRRPEMMDRDFNITYKPIYVKTEPSIYQSSFYKHLGARSVHWYSKQKGTPEERNAYNAIDMMLKMSTDGRKVTVDARTIDPTLPDDPNSKINTAIREFIAIYNLPVHQEVVTMPDGTKEKKLGTQLIFLDQGTPKPKTKAPEDLFKRGLVDEQDIATAKAAISEAGWEYLVVPVQVEMTDPDTEETYYSDGVDVIPDTTDGFPLYDDIKTKLINLGVPANEIAFLHDAKNDVERHDIFEKMKAGQIRFLLTSTQKGGTGVNVQKRLFAIHHLDPTWTPAEFEQRNGRAYRQGNLWVDWIGGYQNYHHITVNSFDQFMYDLNAVKQGFIEQTRNTNITQRILEEQETKGSFSAEEIAAITSSRPEILEAFDVQKKVTELDRKRANFENNKRALPNRKRTSERNIKRLEAGIREIETRTTQIKEWFEIHSALPKTVQIYPADRNGLPQPMGEDVQAAIEQAIPEMYRFYRKSVPSDFKFDNMSEDALADLPAVWEREQTMAKVGPFTFTLKLSLTTSKKKASEGGGPTRSISVSVIQRYSGNLFGVPASAFNRNNLQASRAMQTVFEFLDRAEQSVQAKYIAEKNAPVNDENKARRQAALVPRIETLKAELEAAKKAALADEVKAIQAAITHAEAGYITGQAYEDYAKATKRKLAPLKYKPAGLLTADALTAEQKQEIEALVEEDKARTMDYAFQEVPRTLDQNIDLDRLLNTYAVSDAGGYYSKPGAPKGQIESQILIEQAQLKTLERKSNKEFPQQEELNDLQARLAELEPFLLDAANVTQFGDARAEDPVGFERWNELLGLDIPLPVGGNADEAGSVQSFTTEQWIDVIDNEEGRGSMRSDSEAETQDTPGEDVLAHRWSRLRSQRIQPAGLPGGFDKKIRDIYDALETMAQRRVQQSRRKMRGASGMYYPGTGAVHVRNANDLDTALHEIGHALDDMLGVTDDQFDGEIEWFWQRGGSAAPSQSADYNRWEGTAEFIRAWFVNPDAARKQAPNFADHFEALLKDSGLLAEAEAIQFDVRRYHGASAVEKTFSTIITQRDENGPRSPWFTSIGINWVRGIYRTSPLDVIRRWTTNEQAAFETAVKVAMQTLKMDPSKVQPSKNPITLIDTLRYAHAKHDAWMQYGVTDAAGNIVTPPAKLIFDMLDLSTEETLKADYRDLVVLLVNERVVEKAEQLALKAADAIARYEVRALDALAKFEQETVDKAMLEEKSWLAVREDRITREFNSRMAAIVQGTPTTGTEQAAVRTWRKDELTKLKNSWDKRIAGITGPIIAGARATVTKRIKRFTDRTMKGLESAQARLTGAGGGSYNATVLARQSIQEIAANPARYARLTLAAATYRNRADAVLRYWVEKGRMTKDQYKAITEANESYAAMQRLVADEDGGGQIQARAQSKVGSMKEPVKKFTGSTKDINDPIVNLLQNEFALMYEADRNEVMVRFVELLEQRRSMASQNPTVKNLASIGWQVSQDGQGDKVRVFRNGKIEYWQFEEGVMESIKLMDDVRLPQFLNALLSAPVRTVRTLVTKFPAFQIRNRIRDTQSVLMRGRYAINPVDLVKTAADDERRLYNVFGGGLGPKRYLERHRDYYQLRDVLVEEMRRDKKYRVVSVSDLLDRSMNWVKHIGGKYDDALERSEMAPRLAEIRAALRKADPQIKGWNQVRKLLAEAEEATKKGNMVLAQQLADEAKVKADSLDPAYETWTVYDAMLDAAAASREIVDFAKAGTLPRFLSSYFIPFFNARIRGVKGGIDAVQRDPLSYSLKFMLFALLPKLLQFWWNDEMGDKERYNQLPEYVRDTGLAFVPKGGGPVVFIPMEHDVAVLSSIVERTLHANGVMTDRDAYANLTSTQALFNTFAPADENSIAMTGYAAFVWAANNRDPRWGGKDIVNDFEAKKDVAERKGDDYASGLGKSVQQLSLEMRKLIGAIPAVDARTADFIVDAYAGYAGKILRQASNIGTEKAASPTKWANIMSGVVYETPGIYSRDVVAVIAEAEKVGGKNPFKAEFDAIRAEKDAAKKEEMTRNLITRASEMRKGLDAFIAKGGNRSDAVKAFFGIGKKGDEEPKAPKSFTTPGSSPRMRPKGFSSLRNL